MANPSLRLFLAAVVLGCGGPPRVSSSPSAPPSPQQHNAGEPDRAQALADASDAGGSAAIAATMRGSHRSRAADRDQCRHPVETLAFFGFTPTMTVLDVGPAGRGGRLAITLADGAAR
jgi:hypothetical protein